MDKSYVYHWLDEFFGKHGFNKVVDENFKYIDHYYTDIKERKYLFICRFFDDIRELLVNWKTFENKDIALYLQNEKFRDKDIRWDMYFLLISKQEVPIEDVVKIERNKFCSKKFVINALSDESLREELNLKLPFTDELYQIEKPPIILTSGEFFNHFREKSQLSERFFSDDLLANFDKNADQIIDYLKLPEGEQNE